MKLFDIPKKQIAVFVIAILGAFGLGYVTNESTASANWWGSQIFVQTTPALSTETTEKVDFGPFWEALEKVQQRYVGEIDYTKVVEGAMAGMVASLEDPYSMYINTDGLKEFNQELSGTFEGIGAEITVRDGKLIVVSPLEESPAQRAGLLPEDQITHVDGVSVDGLSVEEAIKKIRGKGGTTVKITFIRANMAGPVEVPVIRGTIVVKSVKYTKKGDVAHIQLLRFDSETVKLTSEAYDKAKRDGARGIILDMRNNPGGYLDAAVGVTSLFVQDQVVVKEQHKSGGLIELKTLGKARDTQIPIVVLVNKGSASASEIVAGALKDHKRATIIGEKTFGKGSVQELVPLSKGGAVKVTIAKWLTPSGHALDKNGLDPDIVVEYKQPKVGSKADNQLDRALEEIRKLFR